MIQAINQVNFKASELEIAKTFSRGNKKLNLDVSAIVNDKNPIQCRFNALITDGKDRLVDGVNSFIVKKQAADYAEDVFDAMRRLGTMLARYKDEIPEADDIMRRFTRFFGEFWAK